MAKTTATAPAPTGSIDFTVAIAQFHKRKKANEKVKRIDNASLPAGAPMTYYCAYCRDHTETLPESHMSRPKTVCDPCQVLVNHGMMPKD